MGSFISPDSVYLYYWMINVCATSIWSSGYCLNAGSSVASRNIQISVLHRDPHGSHHGSLPLPFSPFEMEESLFRQLTSGDNEVVSGPQAVINPNKAILTVDHITREVLWVRLDHKVLTLLGILQSKEFIVTNT